MGNASLPADFGTILRRHRRRIGATQRQLADLSTISVRGIRDLEAGRVHHPRLDTVKLLADGLRLDPGAHDRFVACATPPADDDVEETAPGDKLAPPPVPMNSTIGRDTEVGFMLDRLADGQRLTSITGLTGVGKTRLAIEVANSLHHGYDADVWWMSPVTGSATKDEQPAPQDCVALGPGAGARSSELLRTVRHHPRDISELVDGRETLIFLDGVDDLGAEREWIGRLLTACPSLKIIATKLEPLHMPGEWILPLAPLTVPAVTGDQEELADVPSVRLLVSRILQVRPTFRLKSADEAAVAAICRLLDGLPLAIEHAAFLCLAESPVAILKQLIDDPLALSSMPASVGKTRDMRRTLQASLHRLTASQGQLLRQLSHLDGDWTIHEAANHINVQPGALARAVHGLLTRGFLRCSEALVPRFRVLSLVRYAAG